MGRRVCVIGAGVIGLSTALNIQQRVPGAEVTVIAEKFTPHTTGDGAAGFWEPFMVGETPAERLRKWSEESFEYFLSLARSAEGAKVGCFLLPGYLMFRSPMEPGMSRGIVLGHRPMTSQELAQFPQAGYRYGYAFTTATLECKYYLPALMKRIKERGGKFVQKKVKNLSEVARDFDVVVNCTGVGAKELVGDDKIIPVSGQVTRVEAPWMKHFVIFADDKLLVLPCSDTVILGGTHKEGDWSTSVDETERKRILEGCCKMVPSLRAAKEIKTWVGLRPCRTEIRLESELVKCGNEQLKVVHNYGHGGAGVTLHWGCALEAAKLVQQLITGSDTRAKL